MGMIRRLFGMAAFLGVFTGLAYGAILLEKTMDEYWAEVGLKPDTLEQLMRDASCQSSVQSYYACSSALQVIGSQLDPVLVPLAPGQPLVDGQKVEKEVGGVRWTTPSKLPEAASLREAVQQYRKKRLVEKALWEASYAGNKVSFSSIWKELGGLLNVPPALVSSTVAESLNAYFNVTYDPHTRMVPKAWAEDEYKNGGAQDLIGIGVIMTAVQKKIIVSEVVPGGPADQAGILANDILVSADGYPFEGKTLDETRKVILGTAGSNVEIVVLRDQQSLSFTITRAPIHLANVETKPTRQIPYLWIKVKSFLEKEMCTQVSDAVKKGEANGAEGYVIDLRDNSGGLLSGAVCLTGIFTPKESPVVEQQTVGKAPIGKFEKTTAEPLTQKPLVVLINGRSASASEITAGALQDLQRAWLVGERSYGKGVVQWQLKFLEGTYLWRTVSQYFTASGQSPQVKGVTPEFEAYVVPTPTEDQKFALREEDSYLNPTPPSVSGKPVDRSADLQKLRPCVAGKEAARTARFQKESTKYLLADYPWMVAEDVLSCVTQP